MLISRIDGGSSPAPRPHSTDFASQSPGSIRAPLNRAPSSPPTPTPTPPIHEIERDYQIADDRMTEWTPKLFGFIPMGAFVDSHTVTATEGRLLDNLSRDRGTTGMELFRDIRDEAFAVSEQRVPPPSTMPAVVEAQIAALPPEQQETARALYPTNDGHTDAFRHAYWSARLTSEFGQGWAEQFTVAHEGVPGNPAIREAMDLYNNEVGRNIAAANPDASPDELSDLIMTALNEGQLVVVSPSGHLAWSNTISHGNHGITPNATAPGVIAQPDGGASAQH